MHTASDFKRRCLILSCCCNWMRNGIAISYSRSIIMQPSDAHCNVVARKHAHSMPLTQCHNVAFVPFDGEFEGGLARTAGKRVRRMFEILHKIRSKCEWKTKYNKNSVTNFEHECAPVLRIHVSFGWNQQLASCRVTIQGSAMQSGALATRTENQKKISKNKTQQKFSNKFQTRMQQHKSAVLQVALVHAIRISY